MPTNNATTTREPTAADAELLARVVERAELDLLDEIVKGEGPVHAFVQEATKGREALRKRAIGHAQSRLDALARGAASEGVRRQAASLTRDPLARVLPAYKPLKDVDDDTPDAVEPWRYVELRIDRTTAIRETWLEHKADEMYLIGKMAPEHRPAGKRAINFHLGDFRTGDVEEYEGTKRVQRVRIAGSSQYPTRVVCFLSVIEVDDTGSFRYFTERVLDAVENALAKESDDGEGGEKLPPDWWKIVREGAERVIDILLKWFAAPEILYHNGVKIFTFVSPPIESLTDSWSDDDHNSPAKDFVVAEDLAPKRAGKYRIRLLFRRA